jgi:hAT family C-terminal dimerisation region
MVDKNKHTVYLLVYKLVKLGMILPVTTASVERVFSVMNVMKNHLNNKMRDQWMNDCLITYIEKDLFDCVHNECIIQRY